MQLKDYAAPPEFADQMALLMTALASEPDRTLKARTRRRARRAMKSYTISPQLEGILDACATLASRLGYKTPSQARNNIIYEQSRAILRGEFDPAYWLEQEKTSQVSIASIPTSVPNPLPAPYSYLDPTNMPTIPTYPDGELNEGPPRYVGSTFGTHYEDTLLKWHRTIYELGKPLTSRTAEPTFLMIDGTLDITTDKRGDRPLTSMMVHAQFGEPGALPDFAAAPPLSGAMSFYWRYKAPAAVAPYYHVVHPRRIVARLYPGKDALASGNLGSIALSVFPRPMFGHEQNNNTAVTVILDHTEKIYQLQRCLELRGQATYSASNWHYDAPGYPYDGGHPNPYEITANVKIKKGRSVWAAIIESLETYVQIHTYPPPYAWVSNDIWFDYPDVFEQDFVFRALYERPDTHDVRAAFFFVYNDTPCE